VLEEYKHPDIITSNGKPLELDFFYPQLNIAFEFQVQIQVEKILTNNKGKTTLSSYDFSSQYSFYRSQKAE
jgi:hypothetical protein